VPSLRFFSLALVKQNWPQHFDLRYLIEESSLFVFFMIRLKNFVMGAKRAFQNPSCYTQQNTLTDSEVRKTKQRTMTTSKVLESAFPITSWTNDLKYERLGLGCRLSSTPSTPASCCTLNRFETDLQAEGCVCRRE